ncbi:hypothetical protein Syun_020712 [Stephania yunnanensis]|uniref:Pentatricopeptide repeat-containing protein n=1 Tax=Stephania yunnanensis TaxID=152371 RepID=A0AAP0IEQ4_9MAGN
MHARTLIQLLKHHCIGLYEIKCIHAQFITHNHSSNPSLASALIRSYIASQDLNSAQILLLNYFPSSFPSPLLWNQIIQAYSKTPSHSLQSLLIFRRMLALDRPTLCLPDKYTLTFVITACSRQCSNVCGENLHGWVVKSGFETDVFVGNALVNFYCVFEKLGKAHKVFDEMPERDVVTWTSLLRGYAHCRQMGVASELFCRMPERNEVSWAVMIAGYVGNERYSDALRYFHDMLSSKDDGVQPNEAVLVSILSACAHLGALDQGEWVHLYIDKRGLIGSPNLCNALIDMYARCGRIDCSMRVFNGMVKRDVFTWTSVIVGLSVNGVGKDALRFFREMVAEGIMPGSVMLLGVLNGCSHSGLVEEGCSIFYNMEHLWGVKPGIEHFGCLIDLFGRAGLVEKAFEVLKSMPMEPDVVMCRALLSACRVHGDFGLTERIIDHIARLDCSVYGGGYMLVSNIYASLGRWDAAAAVRKKMSEEKIEHGPGFSWIESSKSL